MGVGVGVRVEVGVGVRVGVGVGVGVGVRVGIGVGMGVGVRVGVRVAVKVGLGVAVGTGVAVGDGVFPCPRQPKTVQAKANEAAMILQTDVLQLIPLIIPALARIVNFLRLTKCPRYVTISANKLIIWTLLSRGVEGPALRSPGNRFGD